jgi:hypothetical protein
MNSILMDGLLNKLPFLKNVYQEKIEFDRSFEDLSASFAGTSIGYSSYFNVNFLGETHKS